MKILIIQEKPAELCKLGQLGAGCAFILPDTVNLDEVLLLVEPLHSKSVTDHCDTVRLLDGRVIFNDA